MPPSPHSILGITAPRLTQRHRASGLNSKFIGTGLTFDAYMSLTREMLYAAHTRLGTTDIDKVVEGNSPFALQPQAADGAGKPCKRGILLTHGLTDSPYFMRQLAAYFQVQGFRVLAILLPGHGTQPGDLLEIKWQEWAKAVAYGTDCLASEVDEVYLGGLSTGATLSLHQSHNDTRVRGLFLFSPALQITARAAFANLHRLYSWLMPAAKWVAIQPDADCYKYESFTKNAAAQMYALTRVMHKLASSHKTKLPIFAAASADDVTVHASATLDFMSTASHPASRLLWYGTMPPALPDESPARRITWVNSAFPEQRILSSAHTAIVLPPSDAHYGEHGDYANCAHYYPHQIEKYIACRTHPAEVTQGEISEENLQTGIMRRLMYNPNYAGMTDAMGQFIASLSEAR